MPHEFASQSGKVLSQFFIALGFLVRLEPFGKGEHLFKKKVDMLGIIRNEDLLFGMLVDSFKACFLERSPQQTGVQFGNYSLCMLFVGVEVGGVGPANEQVVR
jgi:hypothetical protein